MGANLFMILSMLAAMIAFLGGYLPTVDGVGPVLIKIVGFSGAVISLVLSVFFKTGKWESNTWPTFLWIVNGGYFLVQLFPLVGDYGFIGQATLGLILGLLNVAISYLGTAAGGAQGARVVTN